MESLYLLIPLSAVLVLAIIAVFGWALESGQFEDLENEGRRILDDTEAVVDPGQRAPPQGSEQSREN
jgi:cbb3-type cytochrome oxidase maturation protein